jgi:hypothetical protein
MPEPKPRTAKQKALRSTEILEQVFSNLDMVTLLVSVPRVNKTWKAVVEGSVSLQRKLYFAPDANAPRGRHPQANWTKDKREKKFPIINSLLVRYFRSCFFNFGCLYGYPRRSDSFHEMRWTPKRNRLKLKKMGDRKKYRSVGPKMSKGEALQASQDRDRFTRAGASWRRMLVTQPPIPDFTVLMFSPLRDELSPEKLEFGLIDTNDPEGGLRMGQLYDFVQDKASNHPLHSLWYRIAWFEPTGPFPSSLSEDGNEAAFETAECVVEMFHRKDITMTQNPLKSKSNPLDPEAFDSIFKCAEYEPQSWQPYAMAVDYLTAGDSISTAHRTLATLVE